MHLLWERLVAILDYKLGFELQATEYIGDQGVRNVSFLEHFANVLNGQSLTRQVSMTESSR